jgi:hypothetical protein
MVRFGICVLPTDLIPPPVQLAQTVESKGLDMLFFAENSHVPLVHRKNSYHRPEIVQPFARMYDSITALAADHNRKIYSYSRSHFARQGNFWNCWRVDQRSNREPWLPVQRKMGGC